MLKPMRPCTEGPWQGRRGTALLRLAMALTWNQKKMAGKHDERPVAACITSLLSSLQKAIDCHALQVKQPSV